MEGSGVSVERLMRELGREVSSERRARIVAQGGAPEYRDPDLYAHVEDVFRRALDLRDHDALLLTRFLDDEDDHMLQLRLQHASHRKLLGPLLIFLKRRILLPLNRWLYEYSLENFRRQQRINRLLFACVEELAIENARLRGEIAARQPPAGRSASQPA